MSLPIINTEKASNKFHDLTVKVHSLKKQNDILFSILSDVYLMTNEKNIEALIMDRSMRLNDYLLIDHL
jgi:hypothetical protein